MLNHFFYVSVSKLIIVISQFIFLLFFARTLPVVDLGFYALVLAVVTPLIWALTFDVPVKIIANTLDTKNLFVLLFPNLIALISLTFITLSINIFLIDLPIRYLLILLIFILKFGEVIAEFEYALLRRKEKFRLYAITSSLRFLFVYLSGAIAIISGYQVVPVISILSIFSILFSFLSIHRLKREGWKFDTKFKDIIPYINKNLSLGVAIGLKFFSANLMRYFIFFQFGAVSLGYMTPIFYGLTVLSTLSAIFDNIFSPILLKKMERSNKFHIKSYKKEAVILLSTGFLIIILSLFFSNYYYNFFFLNNDKGYHYLLIIFSIGWIFYVLRAILKVVSFKLGLQHLQMKVQLLFLFLLTMLMCVFSFFFGVIGVALAFVIASFCICIYYFRKISLQLY
jgi:O-antigen/teichoic acid export membrane protein